MVFQETLTSQVIFFDVVVVLAIQFDDDLMRLTCEVTEEQTDRMLTPKFQTAKLFGPQKTPQKSFRFRLQLAEASGAFITF